MGSSQDLILSRERLAQLRSALGIDFKRPADLVDEVRWLAEQCNALEAERNKIDSQLGDLMGAIAKVVAHDADIAKALSELSNDLDPDLANRLDTALNYFMSEHMKLPLAPGAAHDGESPSQPQ
jgi:hypothetical protein